MIVDLVRNQRLNFFNGKSVQHIFSFLMGFACMAAESVQHSSPNHLLVQGFVLNDQFGEQRGQVFPKERVSIFALADRKGSDQLEDWITPFYKRYERRVDICGMANLKGVPRLMRPLVRSLFRKKIDYPVMLDWSGETCEAFGYKEKAADIFIITTGGTVAHRVSGAAADEKLNACFLVVDALLKPKESEENGVAGADGRRTGQPRSAREPTTGAPVQES
jgi:hypothetical protein